MEKKIVKNEVLQIVGPENQEIDLQFKTLLITSYTWLLHHYSKRFTFLQIHSPLYAIKTIELMTSETVSLEKVFH